MKLTIEIPSVFEQDITKANLEDFFGRLKADLKSLEGNSLCGTYELETVEMLEEAFMNAEIVG